MCVTENTRSLWDQLVVEVTFILKCSNYSCELSGYVHSMLVCHGKIWGSLPQEVLDFVFDLDLGTYLVTAYVVDDFCTYVCTPPALAKHERLYMFIQHSTMGGQNFIDGWPRLYGGGAKF